jgi:hypothetical protein
LLLRLLESTKSHQTTQTDFIITAVTASGFNIGACFTAARAQRPAGSSNTHLIFQSLDGKIWDSPYFRRKYLYPLLEQQCLEGDLYLRPYDGASPTRVISLLYYSMSCYRRGANSHVQRQRARCVRKATPDEVANHGRWRSRNIGCEPMPVHYNEPTLEDMIYLTLLCM